MDLFPSRSARTQITSFTQSMWRNYSVIDLIIRIKICGFFFPQIRANPDYSLHKKYVAQLLGHNFFFLFPQIRANPDYSLHKKYVAQLLGHNCHLLRKQKGVEYITGVCVELNPPNPSTPHMYMNIPQPHMTAICICISKV